MLRFTFIVAPGPAHAQGNLSGGKMRATTLLLFATALDVIFVALAHMRIRLVSASCANSSTAQSVPSGPSAPRLACSLIRRTFRSPFCHSYPLSCAMAWRFPLPLLMRGVPFLTISSTHFLSASRLSRLCSLIPMVVSSSAFLLQTRCGSVRLEVQPRRPGHQARW